MVPRHSTRGSACEHGRRHPLDLRLRRGLARHARPARRQGRQRRRDDARARPERVPAGFTITTEACVAYMAGRRAPAGLDDEVDEALARLEERAGKRLGDPADPLLVSVRSGARDSMPGMMDTVLNLGLNDESVEGLARATGNERFAWDSYRRLVQMFGDVVRGVRGERFEEEIARVKASAACSSTPSSTRTPARACDASRRSTTSRPSPREQLREAIRRCSTPGWASARSPTGASTASPTTGAPRSTSSDGLRQQGPDVGLGRGLLARRGDRRPRAERRLPRRRPGRGRRLRRAHAARPRRAGGRGCPTPTPS